MISQLLTFIRKTSLLLFLVILTSLFLDCDLLLAQSGGFALDFDSQGGHVEVPNDVDFQGGPGKSFTIEAWINLADISEDRPVIQKWKDKNDKEWGLVVDSSPGHNVSVAIENDGNNFDYEAGGGIIQVGQWHHVAMTYDGNALILKIFIDGIEEGSTSVPDGMPTTNFSVQIGTHRYQSTKKFFGQIDEVRIWNLVRSTAEIQSTMHILLDGTEAGLVAYYRFDEGNGLTVTDLTGNGHNGQRELGPTNGPQWVASTVPIFGGAFVTVSSPNGGETLEQGIVHPITWVSGGLSNGVKIEFSQDGGSNWTVVTASTSNDGSFNWTIPFIVSTNALIRISDENNSAINDASDAVFSVVQAPGNNPLSFTDITLTAGTGGPTASGETGGHAAIFVDVNGDMLPDLYHTMLFANQRSDLFFRNTGGNVFADEGVLRGINDFDGGSHGSVFADLDNDGDFDLFNGTTGLEGFPERNNIYQNDGNGFFTDITDSIGTIVRTEPTRGVLTFDMDNDGDLDLLAISNFLGSDDPPGERNEIYRNDGNMQFTEITSGALYTAPAGQGGTDTDYDGDGDIDIFAGNRTGDLNILRNDGLGNFTLISPASIGIAHRGREGVTVGDINNDGNLDILLSDFNDPQNFALEHLYINDGDGTFTFQQDFTQTGGFMGAFGDLDNDGDLDIIFSGDATSYLNDGSGNFAPGPTVPVSGINDPRATAFADIDNDGDLDFAFGAKRSRNWLVRNNLDSGKWLKVSLVAPNGQVGAYGAKLKIYPAGQLGGQLLAFREARSMNGYLGQNSQIIHFGLGSNTSVDLEVIFLDGTVITSTNVSANQTITIDASPSPNPPQITSFSPLSGSEGTMVSIQGTALSSVNAIDFGGTNAPVFTVVSDFLIDATVPGGVNSGPITVTNADGSDTSSQSFTVSSGNSVSFPSIEDNQVKLTAINKNYGAKTTMKVESGKFISYMKFDVTGISQNIVSAVVRLHVSDGSTDGGPDGGEIFLVDNSFLNSTTPWGEETLTAANAPAIAGSPLSSVGSVSSNTAVDFDVTTAVTSNGTYSFAIKNNSTNQVKYYTKEGTISPQLIIEVEDVPSNVPPVAVNDNAVTDQDMAVQIDVAANDSDSDGTLDLESVLITSGPANGSAIPTGGGMVTYTPDTGFSGLDSFTYTINDDAGAPSNVATVSVTVNSTGGGVQTLTFGPTDDGQIKLTSATSNYGAKTTTKVEAAKFSTYFKFDVSGITGAIQSAHLKLRVGTAGTDASDQGGSIFVVSNNLADGSTPWSEGVLTSGNAPAPTGSALSTLGQVSSNESVEFDVTTAINGDGIYSFAITSTSSNQAKYFTKEGLVSPALVIEMSATGGGGNQPPVAVDDNASTPEGIAAVINVSTNDSDPDGSIVPASVSIASGSGPANGTAVVNPNSGIITYTPNSAFSGTDSFQYTIEDNLGAVSNLATVTITVTGTNQPPAATDDIASTNEDIPVAIDVTGNDSDPDGSIDVSTVVVTIDPVHGTTSVDVTTGEVTYFPDGNFFGADSFKYTVKDNQGLVSNEATASITVFAVNDPPVALDDAVVIQGTSAVINATANDFDPDGSLDVTSVTITALPVQGSVVVNPFSGIMTYNANAGFSNSDHFTYTINDNEGLPSNDATVTVSEPGSQSTVFTFDVTDDAYTKKTEPSLNFGAKNTLKVESSKFVSYLKFAVSGLNGTVQSAKVRLFVSSPSVSGGTIHLVSNNYDGTSTPWLESGLTETNAPQVTSAALDNLGQVVENDTVEFDVTTAISSDGIYSFAIQSTSNDQVKYAARESSNPDPILEIVTDGIPPSSPVITSFSPQSGLIGAEVTINGSDFVISNSGTALLGTIRIMPLGNSITKGVAGATDNAGYRNDLAELFDSEGISFDLVGTQSNGNGFDGDHEGHGGWRADQILAELNTFLSTNPPQIILLHIGTNDISSDESNVSTIAEIGNILDTIEAFDSDIFVVVASLIPRRDSKDNSTTDLNGQIVSLVTARQVAGKNVRYAPMNEAFRANPNWDTDYFPAADLVHPNDIGYGIMAGVWFDAVQSIQAGATGITVAFDGLQASNFTHDSNNKIRAIIPSGATTGKISVSTQFGTGQSLSDFTVSGGTVAALEFINPNNAIAWEAASTHPLTWRTFGKVDFVKIETSFDGGSTWQPVSERLPNNGRLVWTMPKETEDGVKFRISDSFNSHTRSLSHERVALQARQADTRLPNLFDIRKNMFAEANAVTQNSNSDLNADGKVDLVDFLNRWDLSDRSLRQLRQGGVALNAPQQGEMTLVVPPLQPEGSHVNVSFVVQGKQPIRGFQFRVTFDKSKMHSLASSVTRNDFGMVVEKHVGDGYIDLFGYLEEEDGAIKVDGEIAALTAELIAGADNPDLQISEVLFVSENRLPLQDMAVTNEAAGGLLPTQFQLFQNYPNPFNPTTQINFNLPEKSKVTIQIYNVRGELISTLLNKEIEPGRHKIVWDGKNNRGVAVASGVYIYRVAAGKFKDARRMTLLK